MNVTLGDTVTFDFCTHSPSSGAATDADSTPSVEVFEDDTDTAILSPTPVKRTRKTGNYRVNMTASDANGFEIGKTYNVVASATVSGVAAKKVVSTFIVDVMLRPTGSVVTDGGNTSSTFKTDLTSSLTDQYKDNLFLFVTGTLAGQIKKVSAYNGSTKFITVSAAYTGTPSAGDKFVLINF